jgi:vitamin B12 transporter
MTTATWRSATSIACAIACFIAISTSTYAEDTENGETLALAPLEVTSTRIATEIEKTGSSITVVTSEEIEEKQARQVLDVLTATPGISVAQFGAKGTDSTIRMRGLPGQYVTVLIDGVKVSDPSRSQTAFDFSQLQTVGVDRIEVLRGSQSVLYGGESVAGAVNIMTKRGKGALQGSVFGEFGSYDTWLGGGSASGGFNEDRGGYNVSLQYLDTDGFSAADENLPGNTEGESYDNLSSLGRFDYDLSDVASLKLNYRYAEGTLNYDACGGAFCDDPDRGDDYKQYSGRAGLALASENRFFTADMGISYAYNERNGFDNGAFAYFYEGERVAYDFQGNMNFSADDVFAFGVEREENKLVSDGNPNGEEAYMNSYFALLQLSPVNNLFLSAGGRIDSHETFGSHGTYRGAVAYKIEETGTTLRTSYSTGFRAPSLFELYGACCGDPNVGNPNLTPEESKSWDIGFDQFLFGDAVILDVAYFRIDVDNAIIWDSAAPFGTPAPNYANVPGTSQSRGVETSVDWAVTSGLNLNLAYTWNVTQSASGLRYDNAPRHVVNFNANYVFLDGKGNVNLNVLHRNDTRDSLFPGKVYLDNPYVVTLAAKYSVLDNLDLTARIENALDDQYQTEYGYGTSDFAAYGGFVFRF